jgi:hypothetical protein
MTIRGNLLTANDPLHPENQAWQPSRDGSRLAAFMTTPTNANVGVGLALWTNHLPAGARVRVPVRLSSFTVKPIVVECVLESPTVISTNQLKFEPGESVKFADFGASPSQVGRISLQHPENAEITGLEKPGCFANRHGVDADSYRRDLEL